MTIISACLIPAISYAVQQIESLFVVKAFEIQKRKMILTPARQVLYRRVWVLVGEANDLKGLCTACHPDGKR